MSHTSYSLLCAAGVFAACALQASVAWNYAYHAHSDVAPWAEHMPGTNLFFRDQQFAVRGTPLRIRALTLNNFGQTGGEQARMRWFNGADVRFTDMVWIANVTLSSSSQFRGQPASGSVLCDLWEGTVPPLWFAQGRTNFYRIELTDLGDNDTDYLCLSNASANAWHRNNVGQWIVDPDNDGAGVLDYAIFCSMDTNGAWYPAHMPPDVRITPRAPQPGQPVAIEYYGAISAADNLTLHYGFNGWNVVADAGLSQEPSDSQADYYAQLPMSPSNGGFVVHLDLPAAARALHFVFFTSNNSGRTWDNNAALDYNQSVAFPYIGPYLLWNDQAAPHHGVVAAFETSRACTGMLAYGLSHALDTVLTGAAFTTRHRFTLADLAPGTSYYYCVMDEMGQRSVTSTFHTISARARELNFIVLGDMQDNGDDRRWADIASEIAANHRDAQFLLCIGDMPWNDFPKHWWTFFDKGRSLFASRVLMPMPGNHDTPSNDSHPDLSSYCGYFGLLPGMPSTAAYAFTCGPARFVCLNAERPDEFTMPGGVQFRWLSNELARIRNGQLWHYDWTFAAWHIPPYDVALRHYAQQGDFRDATRFFDECVDWHFSGHEHLYQRTKPLRFNAVITNTYGAQSSDGVGYLVVPPAGNFAETDVIPHDDALARYRDRLAFPVLCPTQNSVSSEIGFVKISLSPTQLRLSTYGMGALYEPQPARMIETFSYQKPTPSIVITNPPPGATASTTWALAGTNNVFVTGSMWASNGLNGAVIQWSAAPAWTAPAISLALGTNALVVYGSNEFGAVRYDHVAIVAVPESRGVALAFAVLAASMLLKKK